jgi:hypothetical protein
LLVRFASRFDADRVGPYELARIFAAFPLTSPVPGAPVEGPELVHELAVIAALAKVCSGWIGLYAHRALAAGVEVDAVARATGVDVAGVEQVWRRWADGQVAHELAGRPLLERAEYERVARRFTDREDLR